MKFECKKYRLIISLPFVAMIFLLLFWTNAFAAQEITSARRLWDNVMLWVNFGILVFVFYRFAKKPLMNFLRGIGSGIENDLTTVDNQVKDVKSSMTTEAKKLENIGKELEEIKESILEMGRRERDSIIEQGKITAKKMILDAKDYSKYQIRKARKDLSDEMVDIAISMVEKQVIKGITRNDNDKIVDEFIVGIGAEKSHS